MRITAPGANSYSEDDAEDELLNEYEEGILKSKCLMLSMSMPQEILQRAAETGNELEILVALDLGGSDPKSQVSLQLSLLYNCNILSASEVGLILVLFMVFKGAVVTDIG